MMGRRSTAVLVLVALSSLAACVPGDGSATAQHPAGFFWAVWHGWIAPISVVWGFFESGVRVYEPLNTGWWYDFGYYMAIISGFGGLSLFRRSRKKRKSDDD